MKNFINAALTALSFLKIIRNSSNDSVKVLENDSGTSIAENTEKNTSGLTITPCCLAMLFLTVVNGLLLLAGTLSTDHPLWKLIGLMGMP
jgi:hypothetical protein